MRVEVEEVNPSSSQVNPRVREVTQDLWGVRQSRFINIPNGVNEMKKVFIE